MKTEGREKREETERPEETERQEDTPLFTGKQLLALIVPLMLEQILGITVGMADSVMVSVAGEAAVSGVSLVDTINILMINVFGSLATGGAVIAAHRLGEKREEAAGHTADQLLALVTGIAAVVMLTAILLNRWLLKACFGKVEEEVMQNAVIYFYITAFSFPFLAVYNVSAALSRAMGDSKTTMKVSLLTNLINITGNAVMIVWFHMGVYGVALSTLLSRIVASVIMLLIMRKEERPLHYSRRVCCRPDRKVIREVLRIGVPNGVDSCIFQIGKILVQSLIAGLGTAAIAANAIVGTVAGFAVIPASAMGTAMITVVGQTLGAGSIRQAKGYVGKIMGYSYLFMALLNMAIILLARPIAGIYKVSGEAIELAAAVIAIHSVFAMLFWPTGFSLPNALRAAMDVRYTMTVSVASMWICRLGCSYLFTVYFHMGLYGIWIAMGVDWIVRSIFFVIRIKNGKWLHEACGKERNV